MKAISYMLDPVPALSSRPGGSSNDNHQEITTVRRRRPTERLSTVTIEGEIPAVTPDLEACNAFDRRPPLEAMGMLWLNRSGVVTVYDCGHDGDAEHAVYDAVFRSDNYVWIRSPAPLLRDIDLD